MKERIKGAFTKKKIFHFLKMALFVVALSLILLSLLGTVAHATGLVDDTINAENLYSKYPLSNYQLDFYVDNSWSWLPWNWLDGIGKSVQYGLYCITNFVWTISLYLSNATGYVVQEAYKLDFINDMADSIGKSIQTLAGVTENGFSSTGFYVGFLLLIILVVGMYVAYTGLIKRETSKALHAVINFVVVFVLSASFIAYAPDYIKKINEFSSDISTASLDLGTKIMLPNSDSEGKDSVDLIRDSLFSIQVEQPWLLLQFGNSNIEEIGTDRVEALVSVSPEDEDGKTREEVVKIEIEDNDNNNLTIPQVVNRLGMVFFLLFFNLGISVIMLIISIYGISTTCADMFLTVLLKNKKMKYQNDNLFVARTFASKARTMSFTFGTLSMLILISLLALNYSSINKASYDISVNLNAPYDVQLFDDKQVFDEYIRVIEEEYTIDNTIEYDIYKEPNHQVQNFFQSEYYDFDPVLKLSDYNRLLELRKMPLLSLNDNEYYIVTNSKFAYEVEDNKDIETITVANKNLKLKGYDTKSYWNSITNTGRFVVVLPDKYVQGLEASENHLIIDTKEDTDAELENKIKEDMQHQLVKVDENGEINDESYRVNVRGAEIEQQKAMVAIVVSLFMYIAFILISAVGTILAVQSLSDSTKYKYRYKYIACD